MQSRFLMPLLLGLFVLGAGTGIVQAEDRAAVASDARSSETTGAEPDYDGMTSSMMDALALDPGIACRGPGMMGGAWGMGPWSRSDLSPEQRAQINRIRDETRRKNWIAMGRLMDEQARLRDLFEAPERDSDAMRETYRKIGELRQEIYESSADAYRRMDAILPAKQRERPNWRFWRRW